MFSNVFQSAMNTIRNTISKVENKNVMEAVVAASVLVMYADGSASHTEMKKLDKILSVHPTIKHFGSEIGQVLDSYADLFEAGPRTARVRLTNKIEEIASNKKHAEEVLVIAIEIAEAEGGIDVEEKAVLTGIAETLGLSLNKYM